MTDYSSLPPNNQGSTAANTPESQTANKRVEKVCDVRPPKKEQGKIKQIFFQGSMDKAKSFMSESVWPSLRDWLWTNGIRTVETLIFGEARYQGGCPTQNRNSKQYSRNEYNYSTRRDYQPQSRPNSIIRFDFSEIRFFSENDAILCLRRLENLAIDQGSAAVAQLFDSIGRVPEQTDWNWVWYLDDIRRAYPKAVSGGDWIIVFPEPQPKRN